MERQGPPRSVWLAAALSVLVLLVFGRACRFPFVAYDDPLHISDNSLLTEPAAGSMAALWQAPLNKLYIPMTYSAWYGLSLLARDGLDAAGRWRLSPHIFHSANIALHWWTTLWVAALLALWTRRRLAVLVGAAVFAVHPLQVETVAWATGFKDTLAAALSLPALWFALRFLGSARRYQLAVGTLLFGLALLAKPSTMALPCGLLVLGWSLRAPAVRLLPLAAGWALLALPLAIVTASLQPVGGGAVSPWGRPLIALDTLGFYLQRVVWPMALAPDYGRTPAVVLGSPRLWLTSLSGLGLALLILWWARRRWDVRLGLPLALSCLLLLPVLGLVPFDFQINSTVADRYVYLPFLGVAWAVSRCVDRFDLAAGAPRLVVAALLGLLASISWRQVGYWQSSTTLFTHALAVNPGSVLMHHSYGSALFQLGDWEAAAEQFNAALAQRPRQHALRYNLGLVREEQGRLQEALSLLSSVQAELMQWSPQQIAANPTEASFDMVAEPARVARRLGQLPLAAGLAQAAVATFPQRGEGYWLLALIASDMRRPEAALAAFQQALSLLPKAVDVRTSYGDVLGAFGQRSAQVDAYREALALQPHYAPAHLNLGSVLADAGQFAAAEEHFRQALAAAPNLVAAHLNLAVLLEQTRRYAEAAVAYRAALGLDPGCDQAKAALARLAAGGIP